MSILIVGLGNPGKQYEHTRHNVGEDFIDILADKYSIELKKEKKFLGSYGKALAFNTTLHLLKPDHYMNESGIAVKKTKSFLNIPIDQILIVHDDLDLPFGNLKFKEMGGHGGHNGLRNIIDLLNGESSFKRLRIGIGHPGKEKDVTKYVLTKPTNKERDLIETNMRDSLKTIDLVIQSKWQEAMLKLHTSMES
ncbi:aminoacyl-tRNA hydrolase [Gammaproteobacteria bacterium]|nr:aminoacyl-tRNA hydrolase [Gammaproteobacteria bacterium]